MTSKHWTILLPICLVGTGCFMAVCVPIHEKYREPRVIPVPQCPEFSARTINDDPSSKSECSQVCIHQMDE